MSVQNRKTLIDSENKFIVARGIEGRDKEFGINMYTMLHLKCIASKGLLHRELYSMLYGSLMEGKFLGDWMHVYVWLNPFAVHLKQSHHCYPTIYPNTK